MKNKKSLCFILILLLLSSGVHAMESQGTLNTEDKKVNFTQMPAREINPQSAFVLPKGSERISLSEYQWGLDHGFEIGTNFFIDLFGIFNIEPTYNFLNFNNLSLKSAVWTGYLVGSKDNNKKYFIYPKLITSYTFSKSFHQHFLIGYSDMSLTEIGIGFSSSVGFFRKIVADKVIPLSSLFEYRIFKNDQYKNSLLLGAGTSFHLDQHKNTLGLSGSYLWAWKKFHLTAGVQYASNDDSSIIRHFSPDLNLYWTF